MRCLWVLAIVTLCACLPTGEDSAEDAPTLTVRPAPDGLVPPVVSDASGEVIEQDAEVPEDDAVSAPVAPPPPPKSQAQRDCERRDGRWAKAGQVGNICYLRQSDANRSCDSADDCKGACLARSRTCAPISPLIGCHEILSRSGAVATQCRTF